MPSRKKEAHYRSEDELQTICVRWFRYQYPNLILFSVPNGGHRHIAVARKLKASGVLAGIPDLILAKPNRDYAGLFIEMKIGYNKPTDAQNEIMGKLTDAGYKTAVCYTLEEFQEAVKSYLINI